MDHELLGISKDEIEEAEVKRNANDASSSTQMKVFTSKQILERISESIVEWG